MSNLNKYDVNISIYVLSYEKIFTIPILATDETQAQILVLENECHNAKPQDIRQQTNNDNLFEVDDVDFYYKVNWVKLHTE